MVAGEQVAAGAPGHEEANVAPAVPWRVYGGEGEAAGLEPLAAPQLDVDVARLEVELGRDRN